MIADSADIKFACSQCGQRIVVEKSAAGLTANCPICDGPVIVPYESFGQERRSQGAGGFADSRTDSTREELPAVVDEVKVQQELDEARKETERLRALYKKAVDECERMTANATHAQAEIKSFQSDRQQLKSDLSQARQRSAAAENQVVVLAAALAKANHENTALKEQVGHDLGLIQERLSATETQLAIREQEFIALQAENSEVVQSLAATQAEWAAGRIELSGLRDELAVNQQALNKAVAAEQQLLVANQERQKRLDEATSKGKQLAEERDQLNQQVEQLWGDLVSIDSGRELLELRDQVANLRDEQSRTSAALVEKTAEAGSLATNVQSLRAELESARQLCEDAERRATVNSESQLKKDNDVLRGIVARQNTTLGVYFSEVRRQRRARYAVRLVYGLFGLGLLALIFFAVSVFTHRGVGEFFSQLRP